jgi:translation initiation factor 3 subunit G
MPALRDVPEGAELSTAAEPAKPKWGDDDEGEEGEEGEGERMLQRSETAIDRDGYKEVTIFKINDHNRKVKCVQKVKVEKKQVRVHKQVLERRTWTKFGRCADQPSGFHGKGWTFSGESVTSFDISEQWLELKPKSQMLEESNKAAEKAFQNTQQGTFVAWRPSTRPTGADGMPPEEEGESRTTYSAQGAREWAEKHGALGSVAPSGAKPGSTLAEIAAGAGGGSRYVPPSMRNADGSRMASGSFPERDDTTTVRVSNLSDDVTDQDLRVLFGRFGSIQRVYLAKDRETGMSRGFAFINFYDREDAQRAIDKLNGHGYDHLILSVAWATPSTDKK